MSNPTRRTFLKTLAAGAAAAGGAGARPGNAAPDDDATTAPVPLVHCTDLFHPHGDPDDHWDLACVYALAHAGWADLKAVVIDYPPRGRPGGPDAMAVGQMNVVTGLAVPAATGASPGAGRPAQDTARPVSAPTAPEQGEARRVRRPAAPHMAEAPGIRAMLEALRTSPRPVVITVTGHCRDLVLAARVAPDLFRTKCRAVYVNAGSGTPDPEKAKRLEYNVGLDPASFAAVFDLPCPVYWMPCFEVVPGNGVPWEVMAYGTFWRFRQGEVLPHLSPRVQQFFLYMLSRSTDPKWLRYLEAPPDADLLSRFGGQHRNMWCTAGFLHLAGRTVTREGAIVPLAGAAEEPVCTFDPVRVSCSAGGVTTWRPDAGARDRFIFHVRDTGRYAAAMTRAMKALLTTLP
jgi:hypothetical protein